MWCTTPRWSRPPWTGTSGATTCTPWRRWWCWMIDWVICLDDWLAYCKHSLPRLQGFICNSPLLFRPGLLARGGQAQWAGGAGHAPHHLRGQGDPTRWQGYPNTSHSIVIYSIYSRAGHPPHHLRGQGDPTRWQGDPFFTLNFLY